jgi:hypothetical protein
MAAPSDVQQQPDVSPTERAAHKLINRILKLRWLGMEDEAERMQLALRTMETKGTLLAGPCDTD